MRPTAGSAPTPDRTRFLVFLGAALTATTLLVLSCTSGPAVDPAGWGSDHVGKPLPEFMGGDECLFCHRKKVGPGWEKEAHNRTVRLVTDGEPGTDGAEFLLGEGDHVRSLKEKGFGRFSILSAGAWDDDRFGESCAGCHSTAVNGKTKRFEAISLDCFVCHGNTPNEHTEKPESVLLAPRRKDPARVVVSICGQCHLRGGRSRSTGRPYPNHFVAGDNLFRDFDVDLSDEAIARASTADRHILENVRDVVVRGDDRTTCLTCHSIHRASSSRHMRAPERQTCYTCHVRGPSKEERHPFTRGNTVCEY